MDPKASCCVIPAPTPRAELAERLATALWTGEWPYIASRLSWADRRTIIAALRGEAVPGTQDPRPAPTEEIKAAITADIINL
jgi:hypothetical protein